MIIKKSLTLIITFLLINLNGFTQDQIKSLVKTSKIKIDGVEYYLYKVQKGEGLFRVSKNFNVSQEEIIKANPEAKQGLKEGQIVYIPVIPGRNSDLYDLGKEQKYIYHTVEQGQTVYFISKKYHVPVEVIYNNNQGSEQSLRVGQIIKIPLSQISNLNSLNNSSGDYRIHTVSPEETLYSISKKYGVTPDELISVNPGISNGIVVIGTQLRIPASKNENVEDESIGSQLSDKTYIYHNIKPGETLYSIASQYNVAITEIEKANPGINHNELPIGYVIRIPKYKPLKNKSLLDSDELITHKVSKRETLFGISRKYNTEIDFIKKLNPDVDFVNLKKGTVLKIPTEKWMDEYYSSLYIRPDTVKTKKIELSEVDCSSYNYGHEPLNIAVLLPFNVQKRYAGDEETNGTELYKQSLTGRTKIVVEFYEGLLMAVDDYKRRGININLYVYDTGSDIIKLKEILHKSEMSQMDLIIGPAISEHIKLVSDFSVQHQINMVNPFTTNNDELYNNPYLFQMTTPDTLLIDKISDVVMKESQNKRVVIFRSNNTEDKYENDLTLQIKSKIFWNAFQKNNSRPDMIDIGYSDLNVELVGSVLRNETPTMVVIPSNDEVFVNQVTNILNALTERGLNNFGIIGLPAWLKFSSMDAEYIHRMNGEIISYYGINYSSAKTNNFLERYRLLFNTEPFPFNPYFQKSTTNSGYSRYSIWGYDIATFFIGARVKYGNRFELCIDSYKPELVQSNYHFDRISNWGGFYNDGLLLLHFTRDFSINCKKISDE